MRGAVVVLTLTIAACRVDPIAECTPAGPGEHTECIVPGWVDRAFFLDVPDGWDRTSRLPLVVMLHGGGGNRQSMNKVTCPAGDTDSADCFVESALARGYAVATPDGTGNRPLRNVRTWNGGGGNDLQCTSGGACEARIDDLRYFDNMLDEVRVAIPLDEQRVYATGLSNGGAMSHRLACERADQLAAIVGVAGANEHADDGGPCPAQIPVRQIHGTLDPCWAFDGGPAACAQEDGRPKTSVAMTMEGWRTRNGCSAMYTEVARPDRDPDDGTSVTVRTWMGCAAATELVIVDGGGHTWPNGNPYLDEDIVGRVSYETSQADLLDFFDAHVHP